MRNLLLATILLSLAGCATSRTAEVVHHYPHSYPSQSPEVVHPHAYSQSLYPPLVPIAQSCHHCPRNLLRQNQA